MKKLFVFILATLAINGALADNNHNAPPVDPHYLLSAQDCLEMKQGIGFFLGVADQRFKEIEAQSKANNKQWRDEKWGEAIAFSQLAANYSTVYQTWCAD